jgi:hypothetical protein
MTTDAVMLYQGDCRRGHEHAIQFSPAMTRRTEVSKAPVTTDEATRHPVWRKSRSPHV